MLTHGSTIRAPRSLEQALAHLDAKLRAMPLTDPNRGRLAMQVVGLEDEIDRRRAAALARMGTL
jgi:hypothetical protein